MIDPKKQPHSGNNKSSTMRSMLVASQYAYSLPIASALLGYIGYQLGGLINHWLAIALMIIFGVVGFVGVVYRMVKRLTP